MTLTQEPVGRLVRRWREQRRRSQLDVSLAAEVSTRHLSYIETGRAVPSRGVIERLCEELEVPLRERNSLYLAAGYAPIYDERPYADLGVARAAVEAVLAGHFPNPALAVNVRWEPLALNAAAEVFLGDLPASLLHPPGSVLRATLHPDGLAPRIRNYEQWRGHVARRVRRQLERTGAAGLGELLAEVESYPCPPDPTQVGQPPANDLVVPLRISTGQGDLALLYATTVFGSPRDVTLDEIAIETFFPADARTAEMLRAIAGPGRDAGVGESW
ncbi:helix-turn-helix domain-containing protein [Nocardioides ferulae]|uniref:helix-turn-helix domain-containing protein n=1 Tax=Nocardioides ferulae TaxID=2340821 RepID=UPI000EAFAD51|nr:helix-turn-helix transcriptional regulator [Nocardioides ferulae]